MRRRYRGNRRTSLAATNATMAVGRAQVERNMAAW